MPGFGNLVLGSDLRELSVLNVPGDRLRGGYSGVVREVVGVGERAGRDDPGLGRVGQLAPYFGAKFGAF